MVPRRSHCSGTLSVCACALCCRPVHSISPGAEMKLIRSACYALTLAAVLPLLASAQGTMDFDQASASENANGEFANAIQSNQVIGQSFTPSLNGVGFIRLFTGDSSFNGVGAMLYVNIRSGSMSGSII